MERIIIVKNKIMKNEKFPLYKDDGKAKEFLNARQKSVIKSLVNEVKMGRMSVVENHCMCCNDHVENDIVISEKDRYGLPIPQVLCSKCGLIRSGVVFDEKSNNKFYAEYYRDMYSPGDTPLDFLWKDQKERGYRILELIDSLNLIGIKDIAENGTGMGGVIYPFYKKGFNVMGCDFDQRYLEYGSSKGLNLMYGDFGNLVKNESCDLVLLVHVLEHFLDPLKEMKKIISKIRIGKYLYVEVPGIFNIDKAYGSPILYFQNAHVYNYYEAYLQQMFGNMGLKIVYSDEVCRFVLQRITSDIPDVKSISSDVLAVYPPKIAQYLFRTKQNYTKLQRKNKIIKIARMTGLWYFYILLRYRIKNME